MGYTVSGVHRRRPIHHHVGKGPVFVKPKNTQPVAKSTHPPPLPAKEEPVEALTFTQEHRPGAAESEGEFGLRGGWVYPPILNVFALVASEDFSRMCLCSLVTVPVQDDS